MRRSAGAVLALLCVATGLFAVQGRSERVSRDAVAVRYLGPHGRLPRLVRLEATAASGARVVAVTFLLDGRPLGSVTSPPYALDLNTGLLAGGAHRLAVVAVDSAGRSSRTGPVAVRTVASSKGVLTLSPETGLQPALAALRERGATVRLRPGRFEVQQLFLGSGSRLVGSGPDTVLVAAPGAGSEPLLSLQGRDIRVADLSIDGGGQNGEQPITVAVGDGSADVRLERLRLTRIRGDGVNVWGRHADVSVQDSVIDGGGSGHAGVFAIESPASRDTSVIRTRIRGFRSFGIIFAQQRYGERSAGLHALALDNRIGEIRDPARDICRSQPHADGCGTNEIGIESGAVGAAIVGNTVARAAWDGIETVGSSTGTSVVGNTVSSTQTGIYVEHATNGSLFARNTVSDVDTGVNVEWRYGGVGSARNTFASNRVVDARRHGIFVGVGADGNAITDNRFVRGLRPAILLQGASANRVSGNRGCGASGPLVREEPGRSDVGGLRQPENNRLEDNVGGAACAGS